jgi:phosphonate transport system ATP-binding protein
MLVVQHLEKIYHAAGNSITALRGVDVRVREGEFLVVIGLSGSGKSTLLRCMNRLQEPTSGTVHYQGRDVTHIHGEELRQFRREIGMVFQQFNLIKRRSVLENVIAGALGALPVRQSILQSFMGHFSDAIEAEALEKLDVVGLRDKAFARTDALSGGQQQRVAIARTLMQSPKLLLADEPVASLDPATSHSVMQYLERLNKDYGMTVVCNLHFLSLVRQYASRVIALKAGEIVFEGVPQDIDKGWFHRIYGDEALEVEID